MPSIIQVLSGLQVNKTTTQQIEQIENFYKENKSSSLKDLLNDNSNDKSLKNNPIFIQLKKSLESTISFSQNPDSSELKILEKTIQRKRKEIGQLNFTKKEEILRSLKAAEEKLSGFVKQTQTIKTDENRKAAYEQANIAVNNADSETLKDNIKKNKNIKDIAELYKLINPNIINLARFFSLKEEILKNEKELENNLTICLDFIKDKLKHSRENITLSDLEKISEWSKFKVSLQTRFEKSKRKNNMASTSSEQNAPNTSEESYRLLEENQQLIKEISELKQKISFLATQSITTLSNKNTESESLVSAELGALKSQNTAEITELNNQFSQINENNQQLTAEIDTYKILSEKQKQTIENLNDELDKLKTELGVKEKQVAENSTQLKLHEEQLLLKEKDLIQNKSSLEKSSREIKKLSENLANVSKKLDEKNQALNKKESELTVLKHEKSEIELQIERLNDSLQENKYNDGLIKLKGEEILKLTEQLKQLKEQFKQEKNNLISNSQVDNHKISLLESDINEKELSLGQLKNKLDDSKKIVTQYIHQINDLNKDLELKEQELNQSKSKLQTLTEQSEYLSAQKDILEQKYKTELADSLSKYKVLQDQLLATTQDLGEKLNNLQEKNISSAKDNKLLRKNLESIKMNLEKEKAALLTAEKEILELKNALSSTQTDLTSINQDFRLQIESIKKEKEKDLKKYDLFISELDKILFSTDTPTLSSEQLDSEEFNQILKKLHKLKDQVDKNESLEDKIFQLTLSQTNLENENTKKLIKEIEVLQNQMLELQKKNESLVEQNQNLIQEINYGPIQIEDDSEIEFDESGYLFDTLSLDENFDKEGDINEYKSFPKALEELAELKNKLEHTSAELEQKKYELNQLQENLIPSLQNQLLAKDTEVKNIKAKAQEEADDLVTQVTEKQEKLKESISEISNLRKSSEETERKLFQVLDEKDNLIQKFEEQIQSKTSEFEGLQNRFTKELCNKQEELDKLYNEQKDKNKNIDQLEAELKQNENKLSVLNKNFDEFKRELHTTEETLSKTKIELDHANEALSQSQNSSDELYNKKNQSEKNIEIFQNNYSDLQKKYDTLIETSQEKTDQIGVLTKKINNTQTELDISQQETEILTQQIKDLETIKQNLEQQLQKLHTDNITTQGGGMPLDTEVDLTDLGNSNSISNEEQLKSKADLNRIDSSSSGNFSGASSSRTSSEDLNIFPDNPLKDNDSSTKLHRSSSSPEMQFNGGKGIGATLEEIKQGVNDAFKQENHQTIIEAFINKFLQIATDAANKILNDNVNNILPHFEPGLKKIASDQITRLIFPYLNTPNFKTKISENIYTNKLIASNYLEEVTNSTESIFASLEIKESAQNYKDNISDQGKNLLIELCIENLQTNEKEGFLELAKNSLERQATENHLLVTEYTEIIQRTTEELVTELLKTNNLQNTLEDTIKQPLDGLNLLTASKQKLQDQLVQQIRHNFDHYFPNLHIDPILEKINNGEALSDAEIAKLPSELQYAGTTEEFVSGLRVKYPNLSSSYENKINEDAFKQLRLILRKNALNTLRLAAYEDQEIFDLSAKNWLEKKLQQITKKSISLKLDEKDQTDLDNNFQKYFRLSSLEDMAITHKSIDELKNELKKLHDFKLKITTELSKAFSEIESKLLMYPNLINVDGSFQANLNNSLSANFPKLRSTDKYPILSDEQILILLDKINQHVKNDVSKWSLFNNNKMVQEIANNIISDSTNPFESSTDIQKLVSDSLAILYKCHDLQETLEKRKYWDSDIQHQYALTQKLKSSSHFNQMIENRISKLEELLNLKENDAEENLKALPKKVYLPNKCRIIPNFEFDSSDTDEYYLQTDNFYKQEALKVGKTITFSQKLSNEDECKWSATLNTEKCLSFKTQKKRFRREKSYLQEVSFAQMVYSVNSFKDAKTCTLNFGNCSQNMKERLYLFAKAYNELRLEDNVLQKRPKINCNIKNPLNLDKAKIAAVKEEIKAQLNLHSHELEDISTKLKDDTIRHQIIRSRG